MNTTLPDSSDLSIGQCAALACLLEVAAPKPGNVHRGADFDGLKFEDFLASAVAIAPVMDAAPYQPLGETVLAAVKATRAAVRTNTNLGTILLLAPLAKVPRSEPLETGVAEVLAALGPADACDVYEAIRIAQPGGLGRVERNDVAGAAPLDLLAAMRSAADNDLVARQYVNGFHEVLGLAAAWLREGLALGWSLPETTVHVEMRLMAEFPDSLIAQVRPGRCARRRPGRAPSWHQGGRENRPTRRRWPNWISGSAATATAAIRGPRPI